MLNVMVLTGEAFGSYLSHKLSHLTQIKYEFKSYLNHNFPGRINILIKETSESSLALSMWRNNYEPGGKPLPAATANLPVPSF